MVKAATKVCRSDLFEPGCRVNGDLKNIKKRYPFTGFSEHICGGGIVNVCAFHSLKKIIHYTENSYLAASFASVNI